MLKCRKCGHEVEKNSKYCIHCGISIKQTLNKKIIILIILICLLFLSYIVLCLYLAFGGDRSSMITGADTFLSSHNIINKLEEQGCEWHSQEDEDGDNLKTYISIVDNSCSYEGTYVSIKNKDVIKKYADKYINILLDEEKNLLVNLEEYSYNYNYKKHTVDGDKYGIVCWNHVNLLYLKTDKAHKKALLTIMGDLGCA